MGSIKLCKLSRDINLFMRVISKIRLSYIYFEKSYFDVATSSDINHETIGVRFIAIKKGKLITIQY